MEKEQDIEKEEDVSKKFYFLSELFNNFSNENLGKNSDEKEFIDFYFKADFLHSLSREYYMKMLAGKNQSTKKFRFLSKLFNDFHEENSNKNCEEKKLMDYSFKLNFLFCLSSEYYKKMLEEEKSKND